MHITCKTGPMRAPARMSAAYAEDLLATPGTHLGLLPPRPIPG